MKQILSSTICNRYYAYKENNTYIQVLNFIFHSAKMQFIVNDYQIFLSFKYWILFIENTGMLLKLQRSEEKKNTDFDLL